MEKDKKKTALKKHHKNKSHFENWYFRLVDADKEHALGIMVGKYIGEKEEEAFIQIIDSALQKNMYLSYPVKKMQSIEGGIQIEENEFGEQRIILNIKSEKGSLTGEVFFSQHRGLKQSFWKPGLMGPYKYLPFLKSYHEVISLQSALRGSLWLNGREISFNEGKGYIEKDWGREFPKVWLWAQCNHFKKHDLSLMIGITRLPIFFDYYTSFAIPIWHHEELEIFSNYNGGHIAKLYRYKGYVHLIVVQKNKLLDIKLYGNDEISCISAKNSHSIRDVYACEEAKIEIKLTQDKEVVLEEVGHLCEIEIGGNTSKIK